MLIHLVEDDINIASILKTYLENEKFTVVHYSSEKAAMQHLSPAPHLWILDIMLEDSLSGFHIFQAIKEKAPAPVIFLSARDQEYDKIMGLEQGADDYITKPFSPREVVLRVRRLLSRLYDKQPSTINYGVYSIAPDARRVMHGSEEIILSTKEYDLLMFMLMHRKTALSRNDILNAVWEENYFGSDRVVDDLMRRLRARMPDLEVSTIYGYGYRLE